MMLRYYCLVLTVLLPFATTGNPQDAQWWAWKLATWQQLQQRQSDLSSAGASQEGGGSADHVDGRKPEECSTNRMNCLNFSPQSNEMLNELVNIELAASYAYKMMSQFYAREDQALRGFSHMFGRVAQVEATNAQTIMEYINLRGGEIVLAEVPRPSKSSWSTSLEAVSDALDMEQEITQLFIDLHQMAEQRGDPNLQHFIEENFLDAQHARLGQYATYETILGKFASDPVGLNIFDSQLFDGSR